ncbi:protein LURP-one-related 14-like [Populus alba x Populus x berolinensis]|uniref:Protein LURP-one-related 14-like n=1 Tax=Populus alba x Populus x berolinensis TaxID=444605 RepID=A0AAD6MDC5_9ROSI|nr:protein LURP-one-related 14-like [Populus alba x Populus x berolinensis]
MTVYGVPPVSVVGESYCAPYPLELIVKKKIKKLSNAQFEVFDLSGNLLLQVDGGVWNFQLKRVLRDPAGFPILTIRGKVLTLWHKWKAHAGESTDDSNVLFTVKQSHPLQIKKAINVFLTANSKKKEPDFHISGSYTSLSFKVYQGRRLIAEHNFTLESFCKGKERYKVKVYPEVDYAFVVALLVILDENDTP